MSRTIRTTVAAIAFAAFASLASANEVYTRTTKPEPTDAPAGGNGWTHRPGGAVAVALPRWGDLYIGVENTHVPIFAKTLTLTISGPGANKIRTRGSAGHYTSADGRTHTTWGQQKRISSTQNPDSSSATILYPIQPDWEWIRVRNTGPAAAFTFTIAVDTACDLADLGDGELSIEGAFATAEGVEGPVSIDDARWFPVDGAFDPGSEPFASMPNGSGPWTIETTTTAPDGTIVEHPGVRLATVGAGVAADETYAVTIPMSSAELLEYTVHLHDAVSGAWRRFDRDRRPHLRRIELLSGGLLDDGMDVDPVAGDDLLDEDEVAPLDGEPAIDEVLALPTIDCRAAGIEAIRFTFDRAVTELGPDDVVVRDVHGEMVYGETLWWGAALDQIVWMPSFGALPNGACCHVEFGAAVTAGYVGDDEMSFGVLVGDVDNDGAVTEADVDLVQARFGSAVGDDLGFRADVDGDGTVNIVDLAIVTSALGDVLSCAAIDPCPMDLDGSGDVGFGDLTRLLSDWGCQGACAADLDGDGMVGVTDLLVVLSAWGPCS